MALPQRDNVIDGIGRRLAWALAATVVVTMAAFAPSTRYAFVNYDDPETILENRHISTGLTAETVRWAFTDAGYASNYHPLTWCSLSLDVSIGRALGLPDVRSPKTDGAKWIGEDSPLARVVHVHNLVLHGLNAALLFLLMLALARRFVACETADSPSVLGAALVFTLLWSVHPLRAEVVCWCTERRELLCVAFLLLSFHAFLRPTRGGYWTAFGLYVLAALTKPLAVSFPVLLMAVDYGFCGCGLWKTIRRGLPFLAVACAIAVLTMMSQTVALESGRLVPLDRQVLCVLVAPSHYLGQTLWPAVFSIDYPFPDWTLGEVPAIVAGVLVLVAVVAGGVWGLVRRAFWPALGLFAVAWVYIGLVPMIGIVKVSVAPRCDHYVYWVGAGLAAAAFLAAAKLAPRWRRAAPILALIAAVTIAALTVRTLFAERIWRDSVALMAQAVESGKRGHYAVILARLYMNARTTEANRRAEAMLRDARKHYPDANTDAALAYVLALGEPRNPRLTEMEIEHLANGAIGVGVRTDLAWGAKAVLYHRTNRPRKAYAALEKALAAGYEPFEIKIDREAWRRAAEGRRVASPPLF